MNGNLEALDRRLLLAVTGLPLRIGSDTFDSGGRIAATADGGYITAGLFSGTLSLSSTTQGKFKMTARGETDIFIGRYNAASQLLWMKQLGADIGKDKINDRKDFVDIATDPNRAGDSFINGVSSQPFDAGELVTDLKVGADGSIFLAGEFRGAVDFNLGAGRKVLTAPDDEFYDGFVLKLSGSGGFHWVHTISERFTDTVGAIDLDSSGNVLVTGLFSRTIDFVPGNPKFTVTADGRADSYVMKLSSGTGALSWVNTFGADATKAADRDAGLDIAVDSSGNVFVVGTFAGDVDFNPSPTKESIIEARDDTDGFLAEYKNNGDFVSARSVGGKKFDGLNQIAIDSAGGIYLAGYFEGDDFDADPSSKTRILTDTDKDGEPDKNAEFTDVFVEKLTGTSVDWIRQVRGTRNELVSDMAIDSHGDLVVAGAWDGTATFGSGPQLFSTPPVRKIKDPNDNRRDRSYDIFLWKLAGDDGSTSFIKPIGFQRDDFATGLALTDDDEILLTGRFGGKVDFDTGHGIKKLSARGQFDAFLTGFTNGGTPLF